MGIQYNDLMPETGKDGFAHARQLGMLQGIITNSILSTRLGLETISLDPINRNINKECGYPETITLEHYYKMFERSGYAKRVVSIHPDETWSVVPEVWEKEDEEDTPFEQAWKDLMFEINVWHYLYRVDFLSGIGQYGVLFFGFGDGQEPEKPVSGIDPVTGRMLTESTAANELLFLRAFSQKEVSILEKENNVNSPRYGLPTMYEIDFDSPSAMSDGSQPTVDTAENRKTKVHWTRVLHVADNRLSSEVLGTPRQQHVYNCLYDLRKIRGGSAEMFWKGAFPGYSFETSPEYMSVAKIDKESIREEFDEYYNGLKRYIALTGMQVKPLLPQVADPLNHIMASLQEITTCLAVPLRIFLGSESGHLASSQDISTWNKRVAKRQTDYVNPMIIIPFIRRLMNVRVLPYIKRFEISWTDLNALTDADQADIALKRSQAMLQYTTSGSETIIPLFEYLTIVLGLSVQQATAIKQRLDEAKANNTETPEKSEMYTHEVWFKPTKEVAGSGMGDTSKKTNKQGNGQG